MAKERLKHIARVSIKALAVLVGLLLALYGAIHIPYVQKKLTQYAASKLSEQLQTKVTVEGVSIGFWESIILKGVYISDKQGDTLLYAREIGARLSSLKLSTKQLQINTIFIHNARIAAVRRDSVFNFQFIADTFASKQTNDSSKSIWKIAINSIIVDNSHVSLQQIGTKTDSIQTHKQTIDFSNIDLQRFNLEIKNIAIDSLLTVLQISKLCFKEKSGFELQDFQTQLYLNKTTIAATDLFIKTNHSNISAYYCNLLFDDFEAFNNFERDVKIEVKLKQASLLANDASYFTPIMRGNKNRLKLSGLVQGTIKDLKLKDIDIRFGKQTKLQGSMSITGLPVISETFFFCDINEARTSYTDLHTIQLPPFTKGDLLEVPTHIKKLGNVSFKGNVSGFIRDFVAYGVARSNLGIIYPDTKISIDTTSSNIAISGNLRTSNFALGQLLKTDKLGAVSMNVHVSGNIINSEMSKFKIDGDISAAECMHYKYTNIAVNGTLSNKTFEGFLHINDPNIFLDFDGKCDFAGQTPLVDFSAKIDHARLNKLHLMPDDSLTMLSASLTAKLQGADLDNIIGKLNIDSLQFITQKGKIIERQIQLNLAKNFQGREITLLSEAVDVNINGDFKVKSIANDAFLFLKTHIPSLNWRNSTSDKFASTNIEFAIELKKIQPIIALFTSDISVPQQVSIVGNFNPSVRQLHFNARAPEITIGANKIKNINLYGETEDTVFRIESSIDTKLFDKQFKNIRNIISFKHDSVLYEAQWYAKDSNVYKGKITGKGALHQDSKYFNPILDMAFNETDIVLADSVWHFSPYSIRVDSASIALNPIKISKRKDIFSFGGVFSKNPNDSLVLHIENLDLKNINRLIPDTTINITGTLHGSVSIVDISNKAIVRADMQAQNLYFNNKKIGTLSLKTAWNSIAENISVALFVQRGHTRLLQLDGTYFPKNKQIALDGELRDFDINTLISLLPSEVKDLHGLITGSVKVRGPLSSPEVYGTFDFSKVSFLIDYLKVRYNFTGTAIVNKNKLSYRNVELFDVDGNTAITDGDIDFNTFPAVGLHVTFKPEHFMVLNTKYSDNSLYFGKVYATGLVDIQGTPEHAHIDINAQTNEGSSFNIPISNESSIEESKFLTFVNKESKDSILLRKQREHVNLDGIELDFNLDITNDVDAKIIFDAQSGDVLDAKGAGHMQLKIDTKGTFTIFGDYTIEKGNYLLSMGNVISKRFFITQGSKISWDGSPMNAMIDITAQYNTKASLSPLLSMSSDTLQTASARVPVGCMLGLKNRMNQPEVSFDVQLLGAANQQAKDVLQNMSDDDRNKQFVSLLVLNSFFNANQKTNSNSGAVATSEILSGQVNKWLSGINDKVNIGVNYRPGDAQTRNEVEVGMSTQLLNDRITVNVNGYTGVGQKTGVATTRQSNQMLGDVNVDVKINKSGTFRVRGFSRPRPERFEDAINNSQGVGLFYTKEFDRFFDIFRRRSKKSNDTASAK